MKFDHTDDGSDSADDDDIDGALCAVTYDEVDGALCAVTYDDVEDDSSFGKNLV